MYSLTWPETKKAPIRNVMMNHILNLARSPRSAANTPSWQVTELRTKMVVLKAANGTFSSCCVWSAPDLGIHRSQGEIHREQCGEEHQLAKRAR